MGLGFLILTGVCAGAILLLRPGSFLRAASSGFVCREGPPGTFSFHITAARPSIAFTLFRGGVAALTFYLIIPWAGRISPGVGAAAAILWVAICLILFRPLLRSQKERHPVLLSISNGVLIRGGRRSPVPCASHLYVRCAIGTQEAPERPRPVYGAAGERLNASGVSISADISRSLHNRQAARCYRLIMRPPETSEEEILAGGLTLACAGNLRLELAARGGTQG